MRPTTTLGRHRLFDMRLDRLQRHMQPTGGHVRADELDDGGGHGGSEPDPRTSAGSVSWSATGVLQGERLQVTAPTWHFGVLFRTRKHPHHGTIVVATPSAATVAAAAAHAHVAEAARAGLEVGEAARPVVGGGRRVLPLPEMRRNVTHAVFLVDVLSFPVDSDWFSFWPSSRPPGDK